MNFFKNVQVIHLQISGFFEKKIFLRKFFFDLPVYLQVLRVIHFSIASNAKLCFVSVCKFGLIFDLQHAFNIKFRI